MLISFSIWYVHRALLPHCLNTVYTTLCNFCSLIRVEICRLYDWRHYKSLCVNLYRVQRVIFLFKCSHSRYYAWSKQVSGFHDRETNFWKRIFHTLNEGMWFHFMSNTYGYSVGGSFNFLTTRCAFASPVSNLKKLWLSHLCYRI